MAEKMDSLWIKIDADSGFEFSGNCHMEGNDVSKAYTLRNAETEVPHQIKDKISHTNPNEPNPAT